MAIKGLTVDGHDYIDEAIKNGATTIVCEHGNYEVNTIVTENSLKYLQDFLIDNYSEKINSVDIIGITGTNGKTTSAFLIYQMLNKIGIKSSYIGTIGFYLDKKITNLDNTTPDILSLYDMILKSIEENVKVVVMEVSSHALFLKRVKGLKFKYAAFTNLTMDHLDFHKTMQQYLKAKLLILDHLKGDGKIYVNIDDSYSDYFMKKNALSFGFNKSNAQILSFKENKKLSILKLKLNNKIYKFKTLLKGNFNAYNLALAIVITNNYTNVKNIKKITNTIVPPKGRCDTVIYKKNKIVIDYAHTPDAMEKIIDAFSHIKHSKIITIVGCGGNRDKSKRPIMGNIAVSLSNYVIFTDDNPRCERPTEIIKDITNSLKKNNFEIINNRKDAIIKGIKMLKKNDILLILGKGHEDYQIIGHEKIYFDDKKIVLDYLKM